MRTRLDRARRDEPPPADRGATLSVVAASASGTVGVSDGPTLVASVVLNHNTPEDVEQSGPQLLAQREVQHVLIIVDNASSAECVARLRNWCMNCGTPSFVGTPSDVASEIERSRVNGERLLSLYLALNSENRGYSSGNNVGIRLAAKAGAHAVLVANPDMRFPDGCYVAGLYAELMADDDNVIAASSIIGLDGAPQNPMREATFWEELFWPRWYLSRFFKPTTYVLPTQSAQSASVPKVSGCCLMARTSFLQAVGMLDEAVFLYCEEPILAATVRQNGGRIIYVPRLQATHAHMRNTKGDARRRMKLFITSRMYYLRTYSGYGRWQIRALRASYALLTFALRWKRR